VNPTKTTYTITIPAISRVLNFPEVRNQPSAAVHTAIQTRLYQGLFFFFIEFSAFVFLPQDLPAARCAGQHIGLFLGTF